MKIIIATKNDSKINEIKAILGPLLDYKTYKDFSDWPDVEETGNTFEENASLKSEALLNKYQLPAIADDSGLIVNALSGEPGVFSSRYAGENATDDENISKVLEGLNAHSDKSAYFITAMSFSNGKRNLIAYGKVEGKIIDNPVGDNGFGYDPIFVPDGYDKSFAQMSLESKNEISHRGRALTNLKELLIQNELL